MELFINFCTITFSIKFEFLPSYHLFELIILCSHRGTIVKSFITFSEKAKSYDEKT